MRHALLRATIRHPEAAALLRGPRRMNGHPKSAIADLGTLYADIGKPEIGPSPFEARPKKGSHLRVTERKYEQTSMFP